MELMDVLSQQALSKAVTHKASIIMQFQRGRQKLSWDNSKGGIVHLEPAWMSSASRPSARM